MKSEFQSNILHWYDGMLLMPYHFRYANTRSDALLQHRISLNQPFYWGCTEFAYNKGVIGEGVFELTKLNGILPDGTVVSYNVHDTNAPEMSLNIKPFIEKLRESASFIFLAVPSISEEEFQSSYTRFKMEDDTITTYGNKGLERNEIITLSPQMYLFIGDTLPSKFTGIPIALINWENEGFVVNPFVPPLLHVMPESEIGDMILHVIQRKREKAQYLVNRINNPPSGISELVIDEYKFFVACLTEQLPYLESLIHSGVAHPYQLYLALCQSAGRLSSLGNDRIPPAFKPYNHNDIYSSFDQVRKYILKMIAEGVVESFVRIPFRFESGMYKVELKPQWKGSDFVIGAHPKINVDQTELNTWVNGAVIGSESIHDSLKSRRILGAGRNELERLAEVVVAKGTQLYSITFDDDTVIFGEDLCVENMLKEHQNYLPAEMSLFVKVRL